MHPCLERPEYYLSASRKLLGTMRVETICYYLMEKSLHKSSPQLATTEETAGALSIASSVIDLHSSILLLYSLLAVP